MKQIVGKLNNVAKSKPFLYVMYVAAVFQLYKIALNKSVYCGGMFLLTAAIACQFTKNKALCLLAGLVVTNFVIGCCKIIEGYKEGACTNGVWDGKGPDDCEQQPPV